jgi:PhnB protein
MSNTNPIPAGYHTVNAYLTVRDAPGLIQFLERAVDATVVERLDFPDGKIMHAEVRIGDSNVMISEAGEQMGPIPSHLYLYVQDADSVYRKAVEAGATSVMEPASQFWGDRMGGVKDPWGNLFWIGTHIEDVPPDELRKRAEAFAAQAGSKC